MTEQSSDSVSSDQYTHLDGYSLTHERFPASPTQDTAALSFLNVSGYKFVDLDAESLPRLRSELLELCQNHGLYGTVLLSTEGINLMLCGPDIAITPVLHWLHRRDEFITLRLKRSRSKAATFSRLLVKIKKELVPVGDPNVRPADTPGRYLSPENLRRWIEEGRDFVLLDTRNQYEVELGTFSRATHLDIPNFRSIESKLAAIDAETRTKPVVAFCTGGIRCEKATPIMMRLGFSDVYQLDGGILNYFERCGADHFEGECFVFDKRVAVDASLCETGTTQCYACQHVLTVADQESTSYSLAAHCPYCVETQDCSA
jgi:predicted sulfurtransferase